MPFLTGAAQVLVATIEEGDGAIARESAADVVRFLMKHGVKARMDVLDVGGANATEALLELAHEIGADLMVSGGYGHSRLRQWAFGGVTRTLLQQGSDQPTDRQLIGKAESDRDCRRDRRAKCPGPTCRPAFFADGRPANKPFEPLWCSTALLITENALAAARRMNASTRSVSTNCSMWPMPSTNSRSKPLMRPTSGKA